MRSWAVKIGFIIVISITVVLAGCGGGSSNKTATTVAQVTLSCSPSCSSGTLSLVAGQVANLTVAAVNSTGGSVTTTFTFNSSNPGLVTIGFNAGQALVCAGVWDSITVVCNGTDKSGNPLSGSATITASAQNISSSPVQVTLHPQVNSLVVTPSSLPGCFSIKETQQFTAHACTTQGTPDAAPPCGPSARDITSQVGAITWSQTNASVATVDVNGLATAQAPGLAGIIASVGTVSSPSTNFRSCLPLQIRLHVSQVTDTSATLNVSTTCTSGQTPPSPCATILEADITDEKGTTTNSAPVSLVSNNSQVAALSGLTLTGESSGGAGILASCVPPTCGVGLNLPIYSNIFSTTVTGSSPTTTVYATTSFAPPSGTSPTLIPIDTSKTPPVAGTAITLPGVANSLVFTPNGARGFLGTSAGVASLDTTANTVTLLTPTLGKVLAVSADGSTVIVSNAALDPGTGLPIEPIGPNQRLSILNAANNSIQSFVLRGATAAAFTGDGFKAFIAADCSQNTPPASTPPTVCPVGTTGTNPGNLYVFSPQLSLQSVNVGGATANNTGVTTMASGPYAFLVNGAGVTPVGTCNNTPQPPLAPASINSTNIQMVSGTQNADLIVAVDSPLPPATGTGGVDIITVTLGPLTAPITPANCAPSPSFSNQFVDFAQGAFTARQLLVPTNGTGGTNGSHIVVLPKGIPKLFVAVAGSPGGSTVSLAGSATEAVSGSMTLDGNTAWVGVAGSNSVDEIALTGLSDIAQVATSFTTVVAGSTVPAPPNIVVVKPH
jgi:hypothetical protein